MTVIEVGDVVRSRKGHWYVVLSSNYLLLSSGTIFHDYEYLGDTIIAGWVRSRQAKVIRDEA